jgi:putative drug exporter of the RND superfamily
MSISSSRDLPVMRTYDRIQAHFPSEAVPATVVVKANNVTSPAVNDRIAKLETAARDRERLFLGPATVDVSPDRTVATVSLPTAGDGSGTDAEEHAGDAGRLNGSGRDAREELLLGHEAVA